MNITFKNQHGTITMCGKNQKNAWKIKEITGLGLPEKQYTYETYANVPGQTVSAAVVLPRTITISVDMGKEQRGMTITRTARILGEEGVLTIYNGAKVRAIRCRCTSFTKEEKNVPVYKGVMQFVADNPYFSDAEEKRVVLANHTNTLSSPFVLPTPFSTRETENDVIVQGDTVAEPILYIRHIQSNGASDIKIINRTTGASLTLSYGLEPGEILEINIRDRRVIKHTEQGEISAVETLSNDSFLNTFTLCCGVNHLAVECSDYVLAECVYSNAYQEAMY